MSSPLPIFHIVLQRGTHDCAIACLAGLLGKSYEDVLVASTALVPGAYREGLNNIELMRIAQSLDAKLKRYKRVDVEEDSGVLGIQLPGQVRNMHAVLLTHGLIFDPSDKGVVWEADDYLRHMKAKVIDLLEVME